MHVALKESSNAQKFMFFRSLTPSRPVPKFAAGLLALLNVGNPVLEANLAVEDVPSELPILHHFRADTETVLKEHRDLVGDLDCLGLSKSDPHKKGGQGSRLLIPRLEPLPK